MTSYSSFPKFKDKETTPPRESRWGGVVGWEFLFYFLVLLSFIEQTTLIKAAHRFRSNIGEEKGSTNVLRVMTFYALLCGAQLLVRFENISLKCGYFSSYLTKCFWKPSNSKAKMYTIFPRMAGNMVTGHNFGVMESNLV